MFVTTSYEVLIQQTVHQICFLPVRWAYVLEVLYLATHCVVRIYTTFDDSPKSALFWFNFSTVASRSNMFTFLWVKLIAFATFIDVIVYIFPNVFIWEFILTIVNRPKVYIRDRLFKRVNILYCTLVYSTLIGFTLYFAAFFFYFYKEDFKWINEPVPTYVIIWSVINLVTLNFACIVTLIRLTQLICHTYSMLFIARHFIVLINNLLKRKVTDFVTFWWHYCCYLKVFNLFNNYIGPIFLFHLVTYSLINTYASVWAISSHVLFNTYFIFGWVMLLAEGVITSLLHYTLCTFGPEMHRSSKTLISIWFEPQLRKFSARKRLFFSHIIERIHTKKTSQFGFTYSNFGIMSTFTFIKYCLILSNICMKTYKLQGVQVNQNH